MNAESFLKRLKELANRSPGDLAILQRFFKTGKGQYGEGDVFIGVKLPPLRVLCKEYAELPIVEIEKLLESPLHEARLGAVIIMANQMVNKNVSLELKKDLFDLYLRRTDRINNWDIVDVSCSDVVGRFLANKPRATLYKLARAENIWERRIAMVSTWYFIREGDLEDTFKIAEILLNDKQDLIHKAVGWMLREAGKKDRSNLLTFLDNHAATMPRTALRYAIEHLGTEQRIHYMGLKNLKTKVGHA